MKNIYKALCFVVLATVLVACPNDDGGSSFVIRDRQEVYDENLTEIEAYLQANYLTVDANMDATVTAIPDGGTQVSIWNQTAYTLESMTVKNDTRNSVLVDGLFDDPVDYKVYYIVLNEGGGVTPAAVDSTFTDYRGWNLSNVTFDQSTQGVWSSFPESNVSFISGYRQILSKIKTEGMAPTDNGDGTFTRNDFGNVIVFVPSGLAYFNNTNVNIGQYAPICFQIKLYARRERDHDLDKVKSKYEDINNNGNYFDDDTDEDNLPDFFDVDDDGDGKLTKNEVSYDVSGVVIMPFADCDLDGIPNYLDTDVCP
jgi:FKBP-type peptidyl-prolyl cis-trans isomerase FkpA